MFGVAVDIIELRASTYNIIILSYFFIHNNLSSISYDRMIYDAIIIGGGVIGLSILHSSLLSNYNTILIEQNLHLLNKASGRNSGILCTGVDAPTNSLERALIRDSISRVREFCIMFNVPMRECGSLVCLWPWDDDTNDGNSSVDKKKFDGLLDEEKISRDKLQHVLHESHIAGDTDATFLSSSAIAKMEPSLSTDCRGAVHIPGETVVDPWLFPLAFAAHSREIYNAKKKGISRQDRDDDVIYTGRRVVMEESTFDKESGLWTIVTRRATSNGDVVEDTTITFTARCVINAAGIDSDLVQSQAASAGSSQDDSSNSLLPRPTFEARPRRGQYAIFAAPPDDITPTRPIQPVPSQFTKGIFVYSTLYDQIVVGPTAQDQLSRTDDTIDPDVANELISHASRILGHKFNKKHSIGQYVGVRPGTTNRDYQIQLHAKSNFITVGGIRSTGLTASLGIGRHVVQCLLSSIVPPPPVEEDDDNEEEVHQSIVRHPTPLPNVKELVKQYHERGDGTVVIGGHAYKVTHPLTKCGWDARSGIASYKS